MNVEDFANEIGGKHPPLEIDWVTDFNGRVFNFLKLTDPENAVAVARVINTLSAVCRARGVHSQTLAKALRPAIDLHRAWCERRLQTTTVAVLRSLAASEGCQPVFSDVSDLTQEEWEARFLASLFDAYEAHQRNATHSADDLAAEVGLFDRGYLTDVVSALHDQGLLKRAGMETGGRQLVELTSDGRSLAQARLRSAAPPASSPAALQRGAPDARTGVLEPNLSNNVPEVENDLMHPLFPLLSAARSGRYKAGRLGLIALRVDGRWVGLMASWLLVTARDSDEATVFTDDGFLLHVGYHSLDQTTDVLKGLAADEPRLTVGGQDVQFQRREGSPPFHPLDDAQVYGWHSQRVTWMGTSISDYVSASELHRSARKLPGTTPKSFSDWNEVAGWAIPQQGPPGHGFVPFGAGSLSLIHFDAPTFIGLYGASFNDTQGVTVEVDARQSLDPLVIVVRDTSPQGEVGRLTGASFKSHGDDERQSATLPASGLVAPVMVHMLVDGIQIERLDLREPVPVSTTSDEENALTKDYEYDVALSFAGEDRAHAKALAELLNRNGVEVFYDGYETANLWGEDLAVHLHEVYSRRARYVVMFASAAYKEKVWTNHERRAAQERALNEKGSAYILPVQIDDTRVPGLPSTTGYLPISMGVPTIFEQLMIKLGLSEPAADSAASVHLNAPPDQRDVNPTGVKLHADAQLVLNKACELLVKRQETSGLVPEGESFLDESLPTSQCRSALRYLEEEGYVSFTSTLSGKIPAFHVLPIAIIEWARATIPDFDTIQESMLRSLVRKLATGKSALLGKFADSLKFDHVLAFAVVRQLENEGELKTQEMSGSELLATSPSEHLVRRYT